MTFFCCVCISQLYLTFTIKLTISEFELDIGTKKTRIVQACDKQMDRQSNCCIIHYTLQQRYTVKTGIRVSLVQAKLRLCGWKGKP